MTDDTHWTFEPRFIVEPKFCEEGIPLLTGAQTVRRVSYTVAQLHLLTRHHGFPLPIEELEPRSVLWRSDEIDKWRERRDTMLASILR